MCGWGQRAGVQGYAARLATKRARRRMPACPPSHPPVARAPMQHAVLPVHKELHARHVEREEQQIAAQAHVTHAARHNSVECC